MKVGITGHQNLGTNSTIAWIKDSLERQISKYSVTCGITSLAVGADQLYAQILKEKSIQFTAIIPSDKYEKTFTGSDLIKYQELLSQAKEKVQMNFIAPEEKAFLEAGKEMVNQSDIVFAIWDGKKAKGLGGTGDIVQYALQKNKTVVHINPIKREVKEILK